MTTTVTGLPPDLLLLACALILALIQIGLAGMARTAELGAKWNAGPRDGETPPPGKMAGRLMRAQANLFETLPLFIGAVLIAHVTGKAGDLSHWGPGFGESGKYLFRKGVTVTFQGNWSRTEF